MNKIRGRMGGGTGGARNAACKKGVRKREHTKYKYVYVRAYVHIYIYARK